ncbi:MAG: hypothetical protein QXW00_01495 [Candidatus Woesearchaeota archaeon]
MKDNFKTRAVVAVAVLVAFAMFVLFLLMYYDFQHQLNSRRLTLDELENMSADEIKQAIIANRQNENLLHGYYLIPFTAFIGLLVGAVVYYLMSERISKQERIVERDARIILKFLNSNQRRVVETLLESGGSVRQYELSHLPGLNKVRTHRIVRELAEKGIISVERLGKINRITLNKELFEILKEKKDV